VAEPKVHACTALRITPNTQTFCGLRASRVKVSRVKKEVTCGRCWRSIE